MNNEKISPLVKRQLKKELGPRLFKVWELISTEGKISPERAANSLNSSSIVLLKCFLELTRMGVIKPAGYLKIGSLIISLYKPVRPQIAIVSLLQYRESKRLKREQFDAVLGRHSKAIPQQCA